MLVAAGFGTRLHPLTQELPKAAVPVGNRPLAWFALDHLARSGVRQVVANTHHLAERVRERLDACCPAQLSLSFAHEAEILGTGGGVRNAWTERDQELLVFNAKLLYAPDLRAALSRHRAAGAIATMVLCSMPKGVSVAAVEVDAEGWVRRIRGQPQGPSAGLHARMYSGVQLLAPRAFADLPPRGDIIEHAYLRWIARGEPIASVLDDAPFIDAGMSLDHYLGANLSLARGELDWPGIEPAAGAGVLAPGARLGAGCHVHECVIGDAAELAPGLTLEQVVVWPDSKLGRSLRRAIVTPRGVVELNSRQSNGTERR
jgi:mannose-1-phosphate guanylyltransferase